MTDGDPDAGDPWDDPDRLEEMYVDRRMTTYEIADELGSSPNTIRRRLKKFGIEIRKPGARRVRRATYYTNKNGYEVAFSRIPDGQKAVKIHRLVAVAEYGLDELEGNHVHHENGVPWDNRPENLEVMDPSDHMSTHRSGGGFHA